MTIDEFNKALTNCDNNDINILNFARKSIIHGTPYIFKDDEGLYFDLRNKVSNRYKIGYYEVFIVGSAKLGFSFYKKTDFSLESDVDVAIVNENLFDYFLKKITDFQYSLESCGRLLDKYEYLGYIKFLKYIAKGWMRPDLLPTSFGIRELKEDWFDFFQSLSYNKSEVGNHKINAGLYKNYNYLERYCVEGLKQSLSVLKLAKEENINATDDSNS